MAVFVITSKYPLIGAAWTGTAPGAPGTQTIAGTITTPQVLAPYVSAGADAGWSVDQVEFTDNASGGYKEFLPGLAAGDDIQIPLHADFAASAVWSMLTTVFGSLGISVAGSSEKYLDLKATSAARSATNPSFVAAIYSKGIQPIQGGVGDKAVSALTLGVTGAFGLLTA